MKIIIIACHCLCRQNTQKLLRCQLKNYIFLKKNIKNKNIYYFQCVIYSTKV